MTDLNQPINTSSENPSIPEVQVNLKNNLLSHFTDIATLDPSSAWTEYGLTIRVSPTNLFKVMSDLKQNPKFHFEMLIDVTCVDWLDQKEHRFELVYQLLSLEFSTRLCVKVDLLEKTPEVDSVRPIWEGANFLEREVFDMFGIIFKGHGDLRRILMYDEFVGHPLRKDYPLKGKQARIELRIPELRNTSADLHRQELVAMPKKKAVN